MSVQGKLTALADQIRILSGDGQRMGLDAMASRTAEANEEIAEQTDLIGQIQAALQGFSGGSTGSSFGSSALGNVLFVHHGTAQSDTQMNHEATAAMVM